MLARGYSIKEIKPEIIQAKYVREAPAQAKEERTPIDMVWQSPIVAVSCGYDTCFAVKTGDGLYHFIFSTYMDSELHCSTEAASGC